MRDGCRVGEGEKYVADGGFELLRVSITISMQWPSADVGLPQSDAEKTDFNACLNVYELQIG